MRKVVVVLILLAAVLMPRFAPGSVTSATAGFVCREPCKITIDGGSGFAFESMVAVDPADRSHLTIGAMEKLRDPDGFQTVRNRAYASMDGGATWIAAQLSVPGLPTGGEPDFMADPVSAVLPDGTVLVAGIKVDHSIRNTDLPPAGVATTTAASLYVGRSEDRGLSYETTILAHGVGAGFGAWVWDPRIPVTEPCCALASGGGVAYAEYHDKPWLATGPDGTTLMTWAKVGFPPPDGPQDVLRIDLTFSVSRDAGRSWTPPAPIVKRSLLGGLYYPVVPLITSDGVFHVATASDSGEILFATSNDDGASWTWTKVANGLGSSGMGLRSQSIGGNERLYLSFPVGGVGETRIGSLVTSDDGGATWSSPSQVDITGRGSHTEWWELPSALAVDDQGTAYIGNYHIDPGQSASVDYRVIAVRPDGTVLTPLVLDTDVQGWPGWRGHYTGIAGLDRGAYAVWSSGGALGANAGNILGRLGGESQDDWGRYDLVGARLDLNP